MKVTIPIAIQPGTRILQLRYEPATGDYILWLAHDRQYQHGTFLELKPGGHIENVTQRVDGTEERFRVY